MRRKVNNKRKGFLSVLVVMTMLMATLTACGSNKEVALTTEAETTKVETAKEEVAEPATPPETEEVVEEVAEPEPTPEDTIVASEPIICEGVDMESTLPGLEWMTTFEEIVDEPKFVVYNDETNKKEIYNPGSTIVFDKYYDTIAVYGPKGTYVSGNVEIYYIYSPFGLSNYGKLVNDKTPFFEQGEIIEAVIKDAITDEEQIITCTIIPIDD